MKEALQAYDLFMERAHKDDNIRAALLTSSRANKNAVTDFLSDHDIELYVNDIEVIKNNDKWLGFLGPIMTRWPWKPRTTFDENWITRLLLFEDGTRIDFQITADRNVRLSNIDYGYKILFDKDNILNDLPEPTYSRFTVRKPTREEYEKLVNEFWWNATYVPKYLWRDQLPFAKMMLGQSVHDKYLSRIIEWHIGMTNDWSVNTGMAGRFFKQYLSDELWQEYEKTYCGANIDDNWNSFFVAIDLFSKLAKNIGNELEYDYPCEMEEKMRTFYDRIKQNEIY